MPRDALEIELTPDEAFIQAPSLAALLGMAIEDITSLNGNPNYRIDLRHWHAPQISWGRRVCYVCLGGCSLVRRFDQPLGEVFDAANNLLHPRALSNLVAIDALRRGLVIGAVAHFYREMTPEMTVAANRISKKWREKLHRESAKGALAGRDLADFIGKMHGLRADLEAAGL